MIVVDASMLVAALTDDDEVGTWATEVMREAEGLAGPQHCPVEAANVLRRLEIAEHITSVEANQAHDDLLDLPIELFPYSTLASTAWTVRYNLSIYDAGYVALAEILHCPLATGDLRLAQAPVVSHIQFLTPPTARSRHRKGDA